MDDISSTRNKETIDARLILLYPISTVVCTTTIGPQSTVPIMHKKIQQDGSNQKETLTFKAIRKTESIK